LAGIPENLIQAVREKVVVVVVVVVVVGGSSPYIAPAHGITFGEDGVDDKR